MYPQKIKHSEKKQIVIYGAGQAGMQLCRFFDNNQEVKVVGFLDDNLDLQSRTLNNIKIYKPEKLNRLLKNKKIDQIILAMPSVKKERKKEILNFLLNFNIPVRTLPNLEKITTKSVHSNDIVSFDIEDLLGREPIYPNKNLLLKNITNKVVLVTGAGGSIGSELSRQIIKLRPKRLLLIDNSEFALFSIYNEIKNIKDNTKMKDIEVSPLLCNVNVYKDLQIIFKKHHPFSIFHAAAYKHVDLVEKNISYAIKNNIFSTLNLIRLSIQLRVKNFIFISTDKAVRPTNIMGATKRVCELILQAFAKKYLKTKISIIRFGNVLGSSGSVVPIFKNQINNGGPVTVSHKNVKRFFMTITEAVELVIQSSSIDQQSGKIFYLDMGEPVKIFDLAKRMINLHGFEAVLNSKKNKNEIQIIFTGLKNGEKMYEELTVDGSPDKTVHPRIFSVEDTFLEWKQLS